MPLHSPPRENNPPVRPPSSTYSAPTARPPLLSTRISFSAPPRAANHHLQFSYRTSVTVKWAQYRSTGGLGFSSAPSTQSLHHSSNPEFHFSASTKASPTL